MLGFGAAALIVLVSLGGEKHRQAPLLHPGRKEAPGIPLSIPCPLTDIYSLSSTSVLVPACRSARHCWGAVSILQPQAGAGEEAERPPSPVTSLPSR